ncbi:MAG: hypothetical protein IKY22_00455 [Bacteroidales bacterium]|nr:hypothetical protein [Bacteroidales bacterium]MBR5776929.1 hypothetical protein [Bacteroidales bacterium]
MKKIKRIGMAIMVTAMAFSANAQKMGKTPEDSLKCIENLSLYQESYKMKNYVDAYGPWKEVLKYCPGNSKNIYIRGVNILKNMIANAKTGEEQQQYIDELMMMYDLRIQYFGEEGLNKARKAMDLEQLRGEKAVEEYYKLYAEAVQIDKEKLEASYIYKFFEATIFYVHTKKAEATLIIDNYDLASTLLEKALKADPTNADIKAAISNVEAAFSPYASCEQLVEIFGKKYEENPNDIDLIKKISSLLESKGCTKTDLFFNTTEKLHAVEPSPQSAYMMGNLCLTKQQYGKAVEYLKEAVEGIDEDKKYQAYIRLAYAYQGAKSYVASRSAAYEAAKLDPTKGEPYMIIAALYAETAGSCCGSGPVMSRVAYWAAVDKAIRAKNVEDTPEMVERANKFISTYSRHFPNQTDAFMENVIDGSSFTVGGWIGETTTVRTVK